MGRGSVSTLLVRPVVAALLAADPSALAGFYTATDLSPEILSDGDARITPAQFCVAWAELVRRTHDPQVALAMARSTPPGSFGVVEYLCRAAGTLGDAMRQWARYLNLLDDAVEVGLIEQGEHAFLRVLSESEAPAPASHEYCFALLHAQIRASCAERVRPAFVEFAHPAPPGDAQAYARWFDDAPVRFGARETQLALPRRALQARLASADAALHGILLRVADEQRDKVPAAGDRPLTEQVQRALQKALREGATDIDDIAKRLGLSGRSLQRRLRDEGSSFQAVREQTRHELARQYLAMDLSISEISFMLGFSEPSAFFRAFKRWTGLTPIESRLRAQAG